LYFPKEKKLGWYDELIIKRNEMEEIFFLACSFSVILVSM